jgi:hypothetical protein
MLAGALAGCGSDTSTSSTSGPGTCGSANSPPGCVELTRKELPQTSLAYPQHVLQVYRDGRVVDVYTDLVDGQKSLASDICRVVTIDVSPDGIPPDIENPLVEVWSASDTMIATGPNEETLSCSSL